MDRLKLHEREGKILRGIEEINNLQYMITEPTRITTTSCTLIDVLLTNRSDLLKKCGSYHPEISDHNLIYGIMKGKVYQHKSKK